MRRPPPFRSPRAPALLVALALALVSAAGPGRSPLAAQDRELSIERFHSTVDVHRDGSVDVVEEIRFRFDGSWNGVYRLIPVEYRTPQGFSYRLLLDVDDVTGDDGSTLRWEESRDRHYRRIKVWVPGAQNTSKTVTFRYEVANALRFFEEHDELYWNVTGDEWQVPIQTASARIRLPVDAEGLRAAAFTGGYGSREQAASIQEEEYSFYFETTQPLRFKEGLTVVVGWNPGVVDRPNAAEKAGFFLRSNWLFFIPILSLAIMAWLWYTRGKDPALGTIVPQYEPPEKLRPGELGTLIDTSPDMRDITATIVDLAVRGYLRIEEIEKESFLGLLSDTSYRLVRTRDADEWGNLQEYEARVLKGLFGSSGYKSSVDLEDLENSFYKKLPKIKEELYERLVGRGYYQGRPDTVRRVYMIAGAGVMALTIPLAILVANRLVLAEGTAILAGVLTGLPMLFFGYLMPARTQAGSRVLTLVKGFEEFLDRVEEDRFKRMIDSPDKFEEYLPYAMALKLDQRWARAFEEIYTEPPDWYHGRGGGRFRTTVFVGRLNTMSTAASTAMASAPRSSGGSGFSGGGSSGGGFGGGGGGGF